MFIMRPTHLQVLLLQEETCALPLQVGVLSLLQ